MAAYQIVLATNWVLLEALALQAGDQRIAAIQPNLPTKPQATTEVSARGAA